MVMSRFNTADITFSLFTWDQKIPLYTANYQYVLKTGLWQIAFMKDDLFFRFYSGILRIRHVVQTPANHGKIVDVTVGILRQSEALRPRLCREIMNYVENTMFLP